MKKYLFSFLFYISFFVVYAQQEDSDHFHENDQFVFTDSSIVSNILTPDLEKFISVYGFKNRLHFYNYQGNYLRTNWMSSSFAPLYKTKDQLKLDTNTTSNFRYSFGMFEDHLLDIGYNQPINQSTLVLDFSTTNSGSNYVHSAVNNFRFRGVLIDTIGDFGYNLHYVNNSWKIKENGGIKDLDALDLIEDLSSVAYGSFLETATNEIDYENLDIELFNRLFHFNKLDSLSQSDVKLFYGVEYIKEGYQFEMAARDIDSLFYQTTLIDTSYTRDSVGNSGFSPKVGLSLQIDHIQTSIQYKKDFFQNNLLDEEQIDGQLNFRYPRTTILNSFNYRVSGLWENGYTLNSVVSIDSIGNGVLSGELMREDLQPTFFYQNYFGNHFSWNNNFQNQQVTEIGLNYLYLPYQIKASTRITNYQNYTYLNEFSLPDQVGEVSIVRFELAKDFSLKHLLSCNEVGFQSTNNDVIRIPSFYLRTTQAFLFKLFNMPMSTGFSLTYLSQHKGLAYNPNFRNYYIQNTQEVGGFPLMDLFFGVKAGGADLFVKVQNVFYSFGNRSDFLIYENVITPPTMIRVGFNWKFID